MINLSNYFLIICMIRNFTTLSPHFASNCDCLFNYNDLQFHFMGHHMKRSHESTFMVKYEEAIKYVGSILSEGKRCCGGNV